MDNLNSFVNVLNVMTGVVAKRAGVITASAVRTVAVIMVGISFEGNSRCSRQQVQ